MSDDNKTPARRLASIREAAEYVPCSERTIRRRIEDGSLTAFRLGGIVRVDLNELDARLANQQDDGARSVDSLADHIRRVVDAAPAFDSAQQARLAELLKGGGRVA